jgi:hypothetical protein
LQISVRFDDAMERERRAVGASGTIGSSGARIGVTAEDSRASAAERIDQRLQVLEGGRAVIFTGRQDLIQDLATGFEVTPRIAGERVFLDIAPQRETPGPAGSIQGQRLATTMTARLGEWVEIGATASGAARDDRGVASASRMRAAESRRVWVKVEEAAN